MSQFAPILLAEDNADDIELTLRAFQEFNLANRVTVVRDGAEALDYLLCQGKYAERTPLNPVVVLLDIKMPKLSGIQVLKKIRNTPELKAIPVVMLTSSNLEKDVMQSYELGVNAYIIKPVDFESFMDAIKHLGVIWAILNKTPY